MAHILHFLKHKKPLHSTIALNLVQNTESVFGSRQFRSWSLFKCSICYCLKQFLVFLRAHDFGQRQQQIKVPKCDPSLVCIKWNDSNRISVYAMYVLTWFVLTKNLSLSLLKIPLIVAFSNSGMAMLIWMSHSYFLLANFTVFFGVLNFLKMFLTFLTHGQLK